MEQHVQIMLVILIACSLCGCSKNSIDSDYIIGKWQTESFSWEFFNDGSLIIFEAETEVELDYSIEVQADLTLLVLSQEDYTINMQIEYIDKNTYQVFPKSNPEDKKIFKRIID